MGGVGDMCSAGCTGVTTDGGSGAWLAWVFWVGGVSARCENTCPTSSVLLLGSGEDSARGCTLGAIDNLEVVSPPVKFGFDGKTGIFETGRLKAAALIRPPMASEGSPPVGLPLASVRFGFVALPILLPIGVGRVEDGEPEAGENWLVGEKELEGDIAWPT